jgi:2'-5' RNA ligase
MPLHFIAILTPSPINRQVLEWKNYMLQQFNCKVALKSPAHITLIPPFIMPDTEQQALTDILKQFAQHQHPFTIHIKNFAAFKPRVIYVAVQTNPLLHQLKIALEEEILKAERFRIKKEERPFHPHITIANRDLQKEDFPKAWQHFNSLLYETSFTADNITLLRHNEQKNWLPVTSFRLPDNR